MHRITVFLIACAIGLAALGGTAAADPLSKTSFAFTLTCGGQEVEVVVIGNGQFTPGHVLGSTAVFLPQSFDLMFTFTTPEGEIFTEQEQASKVNLPQGQPLVTCSIDETDTSPEGTFRIVGTVTGFFTP